MTFHEDWFPDASCTELAKLAASVAQLDGLVVEVGSWEGKSTIALANAVFPERVIAIDTWRGSPGEISSELAAERDVYATFMANIEQATEGNVNIMRMPWRVAFEDLRLRGERIKLLFIDAEHTYREVYDNITMAMPLMVPGAVICGDDAHHEPVRNAVLARFGDRAQAIATLWFVNLD